MTPGKIKSSLQSNLRNMHRAFVACLRSSSHTHTPAQAPTRARTHSTHSLTPPTHHTPARHALCVSPSLAGRKVMEHCQLWLDTSSARVGRARGFQAGGVWLDRSGAAGDTRRAMPKMTAGEPQVTNRQGVRMTEPTPADGGIRQGQVARLLMKHRTSLYGFIFACVRNHDDTEDILQNVSVAVTESIGQLQDESVDRKSVV